MGMYDNINCLYPLPHPEKAGELSDCNFAEFDFQTKDLDNVLDRYEIRTDGTLWHELYDIEDKSDPNATGIEHLFGMYSKTNVHWMQMLDYSGSIDFCDFITNDALQNDYWIEYTATYSCGKLISIVLKKFEVTPNAERKARQAVWDDERKQRRILWNRWYMKYGYAYYDKLVANIFRQWYRLTQNTTIPSVYEVEKWLRPL